MKLKTIILATLLACCIGSIAENKQQVSLSQAMLNQIVIDIPTLTEDQIAEITYIAQIYEHNALEINERYPSDINARTAEKAIVYEEYAANLRLILTIEQRAQYEQVLNARRENPSINQ